MVGALETPPARTSVRPSSSSLEIRLSGIGLPFILELHGSGLGTSRPLSNFKSENRSYRTGPAPIFRSSHRDFPVLGSSPLYQSLRTAIIEGRTYLLQIIGQLVTNLQQTLVCKGGGIYVQNPVPPFTEQISGHQSEFSHRDQIWGTLELTVRFTGGFALSNRS